MGSALELTASRLSLAPSLPSAHRMACDRAVQHRHAAPAYASGVSPGSCVRALFMVRCQARAGHAHGGLCGARERVSMHVRDLACICRTPRSRGGSRSRLAGGRRRCTMARSSWDATHRPHSREGSTRHGNRAQQATGRPLPRAAQRRRSANSSTAHYLAVAKFRQLGASFAENADKFGDRATSAIPQTRRPPRQTPRNGACLGRAPAAYRQSSRERRTKYPLAERGM